MDFRARTFVRTEAAARTPIVEKDMRGHQLGEMRTTAGVTQAELADALSVSQARISKIEHGEISGIDVVRAYVAALGGSVDVVARLGDRSIRGARPVRRRQPRLMSRAWFRQGAGRGRAGCRCLMMAPSRVPPGPRSCGCRSWMSCAPAVRSGSARAS
jgi:DNA-binding XRE family transcriptional regulator